MIDNTTYGPVDQMTERVEYNGYDPVVSAVRGRRRTGFRSRSITNPYVLDKYIAFSSDMAPVCSVPEWCDAVRPRSAPQVCRAIKGESRFISDHKAEARGNSGAGSQEKTAAHLYSYLDGCLEDRAPVRYTRCMRCPLNNRRNYNLIVQSMFHAINVYMNIPRPALGRMKWSDMCDTRLRLIPTVLYETLTGSRDVWRPQRLYKNHAV